MGKGTHLPLILSCLCFVLLSFVRSLSMKNKDERHGCIEVVQVDPDAIDFALPADSTLSDVDLSEFQVIVMVAFFGRGGGGGCYPYFFLGERGAVFCERFIFTKHKTGLYI